MQKLSILAASLGLALAAIAAPAFAGDTSVGGTMFANFSYINQQNNGVDTNATGYGLDVKRFYLIVNHKFNDVWSANITTDFGYSSGTGAASVFVKKAFVQAKVSDAFVIRAGATDMPWIPFVEGYYGYRYVEPTTTDRLKFANSSDWGLHASGNLGDRFNYAVSAVNGAGYKNPTRSKGMDVEGRAAFMPLDGMVIAVGGYSGHLGKDLELTPALHTASRADVMVAYASKTMRLGGEYFAAKNFNNVTTVASDKSSGWSLWGSVAIADNGMNVFARYDNTDLSKTLNPSLTEDYWHLGLEYPVTKGIKISGVYKYTHRQDNTSIDLKTSEIRRIAIRQAGLSYLFGTVIIAASINLLAGLAG